MCAQPSDPLRPFALDKRRVRRSFERAASSYDRAAAVPRAIAERLFEHLDPVRLEPRRVLDLGAGTGADVRSLARRYRRAVVLAADLSPAMLSVARGRRRSWLRGRERFLCADAERLPLAGASIDLVYSNLMLPWVLDPGPLLDELRRVLAPGGLLAFSTLGPDTLKELAEAWAEVDAGGEHGAGVHVHAFADMHDVGDALVAAGFADVVMDAERLTVRYPDFAALAAELRALGARNLARGRRPTLTGRCRFAAMRARCEAKADAGGLPVTVEVVYAHAWRPDAPAAVVPRVALAPGRR